MTTGPKGTALGAAGNAAPGAAEEVLGAAAGVAAVRAPSSVGFHQTTRNAMARPTTTALTKKPTRTRVFRN
jgi:hypothetical protein